MKKSIIHIALVLTLVLTLIGLGVFAPKITAADAPDLAIKGANLTLGDTVYMSFVVPKSNGMQLLVRKGSHDTPDVTTLSPAGTQTISGVLYNIFTFPIAAKEMSVNVYAQAKVGENVGPMTKYSVLQYVRNKKTAATPDEKLINVLEKLLDYGAAAQEYFDHNTDRLANAEYFEIKIEGGGTFADGTTKGLFLAGETITVTAEEYNAAGEHFAFWVVDGVAASPERVITGPLLDARDGTMTAVYVSEEGSEGLTYLADPSNTMSAVSGLGECTDMDVVVPGYNSDKLVVALFNDAFAGKNITSIALPVSVMAIGDQAFQTCFSLTGVVLSPYTTSIGDLAFDSCGSLESITLPDSLQFIGEHAFTCCDELTEITVPDGVNLLRTGVFSYCLKLERVTIGSGVSHIYKDAFKNCTSLTEIIYNGTMAEWNDILKDIGWNEDTYDVTVICSDGSINL